MWFVSLKKNNFKKCCFYCSTQKIHSRDKMHWSTFQSSHLFVVALWYVVVVVAALHINSLSHLQILCIGPKKLNFQFLHNNHFYLIGLGRYLLWWCLVLRKYFFNLSKYGKIMLLNISHPSINWNDGIKKEIWGRCIRSNRNKILLNLISILNLIGFLWNATQMVFFVDKYVWDWCKNNIDKKIINDE